MGMVTLKDIAKYSGFSRATVSLVLRDSPLVASSTKEKVLSAIKETGYIYNRRAANLRTSRSHTVGLVIPEILNPVYAQLVSGAESELEKCGQAVFIANTNESLERQQRFLQRMLEQGIDGLLICPAIGTPADSFLPFRAASIPVIQLLRTADKTSDYVGGDNRRGTRLITEHLLAQGHRRLAFIGSSVAVSISNDRFCGFCEALYEIGLPHNPAYVRNSAPSIEEAIGVAQELLMMNPPPTAIVCFNDLIAFGATFSIYDRGLIPGVDIAVTGFDDIPTAASWRPHLSTVSINAYHIGAQAGQLLLERLETFSDQAKSVIVEPKIVVRETSGSITARQTSSNNAFA